MAKRKQSAARAAKRAKKQFAYKCKQVAKVVMPLLVLLLCFGFDYFKPPKQERPFVYHSFWDDEMDRLKHARVKKSVKATVVAGANEASFQDASETVDAPYVGTSITGGEVVFDLHDLGDSAQIKEASTPYVAVEEVTVNVDSYNQQVQSTPAPQKVEEVVVQQQQAAPVEVYVEPTPAQAEVQVQAVEKTFEQLDAECKAERGENAYYDPALGCRVVVSEIMTPEMVAEEGTAL